jgi:hypothetical protein
MLQLAINMDSSPRRINSHLVAKWTGHFSRRPALALLGPRAGAAFHRRK